MKGVFQNNSPSHLLFLVYLIVFYRFSKSIKRNFSKSLLPRTFISYQSRYCALCEDSMSTKSVELAKTCVIICRICVGKEEAWRRLTEKVNLVQRKKTKFLLGQRCRVSRLCTRKPWFESRKRFFRLNSHQGVQDLLIPCEEK